jgi:hypothetical protein
VAQGTLDIERSACRRILKGIGIMSLATTEMRLRYQATERGGQPAIDGATVHSVVLARDGRRPTPIIRNRSDAKVQVTKSTLDALAAAASIS